MNVDSNYIMNYPLISEYVEAIKFAEDNFDSLTNLRPVLDEDGNPVMTSGNFAVVFKMKDEQTGKLYAVKCFLKDQLNRAESYKMIAEELEYVSSTFLVHFRYLDKELFVDSKNSSEEEFPVLLMDWVEGMNLDQYVRQNIDDQYALQMLAYRFSKLAMWLIPQPFAHGDIKPDNILVCEDGSLVLIDYDGMYVPAMKGQKTRELGSPDFRHPSRTGNDFDEHIDDFSLASILLSLRLIAEDSSLLEKYGATDRLLFSEEDYLDISKSSILNEVYPSANNEINVLVSLFTIALTHGNLTNASFRLVPLNRPNEPEILSTEVTDEDLQNAWTDEYGVMYSKDGRRLLKCTNDALSDYRILDGVRVVCNKAFSDDDFFYRPALRTIFIPDSVTSIGDSAFSGCFLLQSIIIPDSVTFIGNSAFMGCSSLKSINIPNSITSIENFTFHACSSLQSINIPDSVTSISDCAFSCCSTLQSIYIPYTVTSIENSVFWGCSSLQSINIPNTVISIGNSAFWCCSSLQSINFPDSVVYIGNSAFCSCSSLQSINIPNSVTSIGDYTFSDCSSLQSIYIPNSVTSIGNYAFWGCSSLCSINISNFVTSIGEYAFTGCYSLQQILVSSWQYYRIKVMIPRELQDKLRRKLPWE